MAQMIVRNIDDSVKNAFKARASLHGWTMEEEAHQILQQAVNDPPQTRAKLVTLIAARFADESLLEPLPEWRGHTIAPVALGVALGE